MNDDSPHSIQIPASMWRWAENQSRISNQGPASFLRNILTGVMSNASAVSQYQNSVNVNTSTGGKGIHIKCYEAMVNAFVGTDFPSATPWEAQRVTICPKCRLPINVGDTIVITKHEDWR
jgi:hypothetical protein